MEFLDLIKLDEAFDLDKSGKTGFTRRDLLKEIYTQSGTDAFSARVLKPIKVKMDEYFVNNSMKALLKNGFIEKIGKEYKLTQEGLGAIGVKADEITQDDVDSATLSKAKVIKNLDKTKSIKFKVPKVSKSSQYLDQMKTLLRHMKSTAEGTTKKTYMLAGDPGTGKTSFIESLATLTGIPLVVIEAPHITQEHLINIPFLVIDGQKRKEGNITVDDSGDTSFKIVQAESALVTTLKSKKKRTPEQIQKEINKNKVLREIQPLLKRNLEIVRTQYNSILFLDEFYRCWDGSQKIEIETTNIEFEKFLNEKIN